MANPETSDSAQVKLVHQWGRGFQTRDLDLIEKALHKDYRYALYPKSLGKPEETREEWLARFAGVLSLWAADQEEPVIHSMIDTPGKVITHTTNKSKTPFGEMIRESIFILDIVADEDGNLKIKRMEEFTDSKAHLDFYQVVAAAKKQ